MIDRKGKRHIRYGKVASNVWQVSEKKNVGPSCAEINIITLDKENERDTCA